MKINKNITPVDVQVQYNEDLARGSWVWCSFAKKEAKTANGFCFYCGSTDHELIKR